MSRHARKHWLVAYDIRDAKRLSRIHRYLRKRGFALQYSVFAIEGDDSVIAALMDDLLTLMAPDKDDIRAYHLPQRCMLWKLGAQALPDGIELYASMVTHLLRRAPVERTAANASLPLRFG